MSQTAASVSPQKVEPVIAAISVAATDPGPRSMILTVTPGFCRKSQHGFPGSLTLARFRLVR